MADDKSTEDVKDINTSTNEEAQDTEVDLEDIEVSEEDISSDTDEEESDDSKDEKKTDTEPESKEESEEDEDESDEDSDEADDTDETEESEEESEEETEEKDTISEAEQKRINNENARKRIAEREANKAKAQQEYLDEAEDDKDLALRQLQIDAYNNKVEGNANKLQNGIDRALANIDIFKTGTPVEKEELAKRLDDFERMYVKYDQNGDPIEVKSDVYQYLTREADSIQRLTRVGARKQVKDKSKTKSRTTTTPSKAPPPPKKDPDLDAFDEEASKY